MSESLRNHPSLALLLQTIVSYRHCGIQRLADIAFGAERVGLAGRGDLGGPVDDRVADDVHLADGRQIPLEHRVFMARALNGRAVVVFGKDDAAHVIARPHDTLLDSF